jgi:hypothetical protein
MKSYIGTKLIKADPSTKGDYINFTGNLASKEDFSLDGYMVVYSDGYVSWSPKDVFEEAYREIDGLNFGIALESCKQGSKIARAGWNGKGMFVVYQKGYPQGIPSNKQTAEAWGLNEGDLFICNPYLQIKCADGSHSMWTPSINDTLAEDWMVIE